MKLRLLRLTLVLSAFAWGVSLFGVFASWPAAQAALQELGAKSINHDPMLDYWLRMAAGFFSLVGALFLVLALRPLQHRAIIPWFGGLMLVEGVVLLVHGLRLQLPPIPFAADTLACLGAGAAILYLSRGAFAELPTQLKTEH
jgi:FtsH-binding integral membrane protein